MQLTLIYILQIGYLLFHG